MPYGIVVCQAGDGIDIERDDAEDPPPQNKTNNKTAKKKDVKAGGGKKQLSIATMLRPQPAKPKKKQNLVVRLVTKKGFGESEGHITAVENYSATLVEFGRLPQDVASWVSKLLDLGM